MTVITRFAPSPTGYLHIWSLRTVLFNYLYTKKNNGKFMLRIEDTDRNRFVEGSVENLLEVLASVGLIPDEGPNNPGEKGPYYQSERLDIYAKYIEELLEKDKAYHCFCSSERLTELREEQQALNLPTKYDKKCRYLTKEEIQEKLDSGVNYTVRLKVPDNKDVQFIDQVRGKILINTKDVDDQVLLKTDKFPTYHFAVVVDDHLMGITEIIRGDEWIPSTPKHILLYDAFGWELPKYSHVPPLLGLDWKKLSKRTWDVAVEKYLEKGYLVEALMNYLALLGWNPKTTEEFFTMEELIERFELMNVQKAWAKFDVTRLDFFNSHYLKTMDSEVVYNKLMTYLKRYDKDFLDALTQYPQEYILKIVNELKTKMKHFSEFKQLTTFFFDDASLASEELYVNQKMKITDKAMVIKALEVTKELLESQSSDFTDPEVVKNSFIDAIKSAEMKNGQVLWPVRVALSGEQFSPGALELVFILGLETSIKRLEKALKNLI